jgi:hypothetical protein
VAGALERDRENETYGKRADLNLGRCGADIHDRRPQLTENKIGYRVQFDRECHSVSTDVAKHYPDIVPGVTIDEAGHYWVRGITTEGDDYVSLARLELYAFIESQRQKPTYNHTRGDSAATPCAVCEPRPFPLSNPSMTWDEALARDYKGGKRFYVIELTISEIVELINRSEQYGPPEHLDPARAREVETADSNKIRIEVEL